MLACYHLVTSLSIGIFAQNTVLSFVSFVCFAVFRATVMDTLLSYKDFAWLVIYICQYEPVVEVFEGDKEKVTYIKMTPEKAKRVIAEHIKGGNIVTEYTIGSIEA